MLACQSTQGPIVQHKLQPIIKKKSFHTHTPPSRFQLDRTAPNHPMSADHPSLSLPAEKTSHHSLSLSLSLSNRSSNKSPNPPKPNQNQNLSLSVARVGVSYFNPIYKKTHLSLSSSRRCFLYIYQLEEEKRKNKEKALDLRYIRHSDHLRSQAIRYPLSFPLSLSLISSMKYRCRGFSLSLSLHAAIGFFLIRFFIFFSTQRFLILCYVWLPRKCSESLILRQFYFVFFASKKKRVY